MGSVQNVNRQVNEILSSVVVDIWIDQTINCQTSLDLSQSIVIESLPYRNFTPPGDPVVPIAAALESGPGCVACIESVELAQRTMLQNFVKLRGHKNIRPFPTTEEFLRSLFNTLQSSCAGSCKSTSVTNVSQTLNVALNASCVSSTEQNLEFYNNLEVSILQRLVNDKDLLAGLVTAFSALIPWGRGSVNEQISKLLAEVKTSLQSSSVADMGAQMLATQNIVVSGGGGVVVDRVSQNAMKTYMVKNVYGALQNIKVVNENNYTAVQELIDKNSSLKDIFASAGRIGTTWIDSLSSAWQAVLFVAIGVTVLIFAIWMIIAIWAYVNANNDLKRARKEGCDVSFRRAIPEGATAITAPTLEGSAPVPNAAPIPVSTPAPIKLMQAPAPTPTPA
jgi:hypothetical protein